MTETYFKPQDPENKRKSNGSQLMFNIIIVAFMFFIGIILQSKGYFDIEQKNDTSYQDENRTELKVVNTNESDTVLVYLTLSSGDKFVSDVNGIFGIKSQNKLQGSFYLPPNDTVSYICPSNKGIDGNISFNRPPTNCPYIGSTLYEFVLNNNGTVSDAQETVDISCVAGVSSYGSISMSGGGIWSDNYNADTITLIKNNPIYQNTNVSGVFPFGCTNCTNKRGAPNCSNRPAYAVPSDNKICTVQRDAKKNGGEILIAFISKAP